MILTWADFVNVRWLRECGFVDSTRGVTGRSDNRAMGLAKEDQRETNRQDSSDAVGTSPIEG
ncbi:MAG: hypothetical protein DMF12_08690 [Verrucomicrobia bacterium]|nr:MAG: hypothetical protein DMF12_08690 [Verrucomicrobiota bacterium]PYI66506.1 MAG: hypothetical protein DMF07_03945 [Verrucomicrobiota bacterium]